MSTARNKTVLLAALGGGLVILLFFVFFHTSARKTDAATDSRKTPENTAAIRVSTAVAMTQQVAKSIEATGSLAGDESSDVAPPAAGQVVATPVDVGAYVREGTVIARLDDRDARLRLARAEAAEQQATAALAQARARIGMTDTGQFDPSKTPEVQSARLAYERADAQAKLAESNAQRYASLFGTGDVSRSVYDQYRTQAETARADANAAKQQLDSAMNASRSSDVGIKASQSALDAARAESGLAQKAVNDTVVRAPINGYVSDRPVAVGEYVSLSSKVATIVTTNPIKVALRLPESDAGRIKLGYAVTVTVAAYPNQRFNGVVTATNPAIDPASRALTVEAKIQNDANMLRPGMFVNGQIALPDTSTGVFIPKSAVLTDSATNSSTAFVIDGDTARVRVVALGSMNGDLVEVASGIAAGETVAVSNLQELFDGARVMRQ